MINITDTHFLEAALSKLSVAQAPLFGTMGPQQMIEHLLFFVEISLGIHPQTLLCTEEQAAKNKQFLLHEDRAMPEGLKLPSLNGMQATLQFSNLDRAVKALLEAVQQFNTIAIHTPALHPVAGLLDKDEWKSFHDKHFTHHFKQFTLS